MSTHSRNVVTFRGWKSNLTYAHTDMSFTEYLSNPNQISILWGGRGGSHGHLDSTSHCVLSFTRGPFDSPSPSSHLYSLLFPVRELSAELPWPALQANLIIMSMCAQPFVGEGKRDTGASGKSTIHIVAWLYLPRFLRDYSHKNLPYILCDNKG